MYVGLMTLLASPIRPYGTRRAPHTYEQVETICPPKTCVQLSKNHRECRGQYSATTGSQSRKIRHVSLYVIWLSHGRAVVVTP